ncbi:MAG: hypothetical protein K8R89_03530 [Anaerolineae bacterium]|nr:hypothetical protein [Anaerolineae bacterium]
MKKDSTLLIRMEIPFEDAHNATSGSAMIFHKWLPLDEEDFFVVIDNEITLKFWFDVKCTWWASQPDEDEISRWTNVLARIIYLDITVRNLDNTFLEYISAKTQEDRAKLEDPIRKNQYIKLGEHIQSLFLHHLNRLISYVRAHKGQYWLQEFPLSRDYFSKFSAKAKINNGNWFRFLPPNEKKIKLVISKNYDRFIDKNSWNLAKDFVISNKKPELHWYLLSGAEYLKSKGDSRAALTEAITALEIAINVFAKSEISSVFGEKIADRMGIERFDKQIDHMGLSGTLRYLFPVVFSEEQIPTSVLNTCQDALDYRGNVVHGGQRKVDSKKLRIFIKGIRELCELLEKLLKDNEPA